ncbi:MAG: hypothetical protein AB7Q17_03800, partial [Phycisphaerae bacterium]
MHARRGNAFVPDGISVWEVSTAQRIATKADKDFRKRTADPLTVAPADATYVALSLRRWPRKETWAAEKKRGGPWRDVRAYDADDLAQWLETAPVVQFWVDEILNKPASIGFSIDAVWKSWSHVTSPPTLPSLVLAGRDVVAGEIESRLSKPASPVIVQADSREEAIAVVVATLVNLPADRYLKLATRTLVVREGNAWNHLLSTTTQLILIKDFRDDAALGTGAARSHVLVYPLGRADHPSNDAIGVPRLDPVATVSALQKMGLDEQRANSLVTATRGALLPLRRRTGSSPEISQPAWSRPENAVSLLPALLVGRWSEQNTADQAALSDLAGAPFDEVKNHVNRWRCEDDSPVDCVGSAWYLRAHEDAWALLGRFLTSRHLQRFRQLVVRTFASPAQTPEVGASASGEYPERSAARESTLLRTGLANSLAIMGAYGDTIRLTSGSLTGVAEACVRDLLPSADLRGWDLLPLRQLAEAAPDAFLDALNRALRAQSPSIQQHSSEGAVFASHVSSPMELLWALELLAWNPDCLARVAEALTALARLDAADSSDSRPLASLRAIFLPWHPQTGATLEQRLSVIDAIRRQARDVAWALLIRLLPEPAGFTHSSAQPGRRSWVPDGDRAVLASEYQTAIVEIAHRAIDDAERDGNRWASLVEKLRYLPAAQCERALHRLDQMAASRSLPPQHVLPIRDALRELISLQRSAPDNAWSFPADGIERLLALYVRFEPPDLVDRVRWLFEKNPMLLEGHHFDLEEEWIMLQQQQDGAVRAIAESHDVSTVELLVVQVARADQLGRAVAQTGVYDEQEERLLAAALATRSRPWREFLRWYSVVRLQQRGYAWARRVCSNDAICGSSAHQSFFCECLPLGADTWDFVDSLA